VVGGIHLAAPKGLGGWAFAVAFGQACPRTGAECALALFHRAPASIMILGVMTVLGVVASLIALIEMLRAGGYKIPYGALTALWAGVSIDSLLAGYGITPYTLFGLFLYVLPAGGMYLVARLAEGRRGLQRERRAREPHPLDPDYPSHSGE
jgi:ABC-type dipeptide/oligopeptide/nickel transport system permease component